MRTISLEQLDKDIEGLRKLVADGKVPQPELDGLIELRDRLQHTSPDDWDAYGFLIEHLPPDDADDLLIVLKGHLLLEFQVREFVRRRMLNPDAVDAGRLSSFAMICLAEALCLPTEEPKWLWTRVKQLNALRNKLAHNLAINQVKNQIEDFVGEVSRRQTLASPTLGGAISRLYGMVKALGDLANDPDFRLPR